MNKIEETVNAIANAMYDEHTTREFKNSAGRLALLIYEDNFAGKLTKLEFAVFIGYLIEILMSQRERGPAMSGDVS